MMKPYELVKVVTWEDTGQTLMARVEADAANITQAAISSIAYKIYDLSSLTPTTELGDSAALVVADVVFDTLQTDSRWDADSTGYNFRHTVAASTLGTGDHKYGVKYTFTPAAGQPFLLEFEIWAKKAYG
jgi:predicted proteasome-type protease